MSDLELHVITHAEVAPLWLEMRPLVDKCIQKAYHGEMNADDVFDLINQKKAFAIVGFVQGEVVIVGVFEPIEYPQMRTISCILVASTSRGIMKKIDAQWMDKIRDHARSLGVNAIECMASESMGRILRRMGYRKLYDFFRMDLR